MAKIILFDGICNFCNDSVQFIIKRDPDGLFVFASLQGEKGKEILRQRNVPPQVESLVLIEGDRYYVKSTAALRICMFLRGGWKLLQIFMIVPRPCRDWFYDVFAKNRYKWFGKKEVCERPSIDFRSRFLE
ncbi:thiol-disulfide oxidoreductase DCC family protein [Halalkalibacter alkalisediminis]|uniref:Thiol-disulfide oxidoreductase DCC family protein n=1 Tax=Halalkalibacter alkalisediminis TaxID=935616 RepID=A0ABV6NNU0_9BACI|nr:DCC1-like thiol-disulfide oxidoreductase family protein [Halalkalibacter alkalisediminis]